MTREKMLENLIIGGIINSFAIIIISGIDKKLGNIYLFVSIVIMIIAYGEPFFSGVNAILATIRGSIK